MMSGAIFMDSKYSSTELSLSIDHSLSLCVSSHLAVSLLLFNTIMIRFNQSVSKLATKQAPAERVVPVLSPL